jgi:hypothetical protein
METIPAMPGTQLFFQMLGLGTQLFFHTQIPCWRSQEPNQNAGQNPSPPAPLPKKGRGEQSQKDVGKDEGR